MNQLRAFVSIAHEGNLTRAAQHLHLSQPAVSLQLKALQTSLDVQLLIRAPGGMQLTAAGRKLLPFAERILANTTEFQQALQTLQSTVAGKLSIGTILDPEFIRLGSFLKMLVEHSPQLSTQLRHGMSGNVLEQVQAGTLDAGFYLGLPAREFHTEVLTRFTYNVVAPQGWKSRVDGRDWDALARLPWIWSPPESAHNRLLSKKFSDYKIWPEQVALVDQESSMLDLVKSGIGLSLVRASIAIHEAHVHGLVIADTVSLSTELSFIALQRRKNEPAIATAFGLLKTLWKQ